MIIPNDTGHPWRLRKFVEYAHTVPPIGPATYLAWAKIMKLSPDDCVRLAWYNSTCYCELTAIFLSRTIPKKPNTMIVEKFWTEHKERLIFASARMYAKNMDWFVPLMDKFLAATNGEPLRWLRRIATEGSPQERYANVYHELMSWPYMGRFSVELFTDAVVQLGREGLLEHLRFEAESIDWRKGSNLTSGLLNMFYQDELADHYDDTKKLEDRVVQLLDKSLAKVQKETGLTHPNSDTSVSVITPKICSWRNLFKGRRYMGYHQDRQLAQLYAYQKNYPGDRLWEALFALRKRVLAPKLLGEIGGWTGIRKERMKLWVREGRLE